MRTDRHDGGHGGPDARACVVVWEAGKVVRVSREMSFEEAVEYSALFPEAMAVPAEQAVMLRAQMLSGEKECCG